MALSEVFNLDFKFGGNSEFLSRLEKLMERVDARFASVTDDVKEATDETKKMADAVDDLSDSFNRGMGSLSSFGEKLKDIAKYYLSFSAAKMGAEKVWSFGMQSMDAFATQERAENQLKGVLRNRGTLDQFDEIKGYAADIQSRSIYGDEAMIKAAGELATYVKGTGSIKSMMDLLTDYAAGMTGGGAVSPEQMESLATGLGMAYDGNYMAMRRKGFDTSKLEAIDALQESGGVWTAKMQKKYGSDWSKEEINDFKNIVKEAKKAGGVTEQMRVDALKESLEDWKGLSDAVNDLSSSALVKLNNKLGDLRENLGEKLYPVFNSLVQKIDENMPAIEKFYDKIGELFTTLSNALLNNLDGLILAADVIGSTLSFVAEYPKPILVTVAAMKLVPPALQMIQKTSMALATGGFKSLAGSLTALVNPVSLAGVAIVGLAGVLWDTWDKSIKAQNKHAREVSSENADKKIKDYAALQDQYNASNNEFEKRGIWERMQSARREAEKQVQIYAEANDGYAKAEWQKFFTGGLMMTDSTGRKKGYVKWGTSNAEKTLNPFDMIKSEASKAAKAAQKSTKGEVNLHQSFTTINQEVTLTPRAEQMGVMLNQRVRRIIENQIKRNQEIAII